MTKCCICKQDCAAGLFHYRDGLTVYMCLACFDRGVRRAGETAVSFMADILREGCGDKLDEVSRRIERGLRRTDGRIV